MAWLTYPRFAYGETTMNGTRKPSRPKEESGTPGESAGALPGGHGGGEERLEEVRCFRGGKAVLVQAEARAGEEEHPVREGRPEQGREVAVADGEGAGERVVEGEVVLVVVAHREAAVRAHEAVV